jgi:hypothetical protein
MEKENIRNPRYPHIIKIVRKVVGKADPDDPFADDDAPVGEDKGIILYYGEGRSYTDTTTEGDKNVDQNKRKASIPVRYDEWDADRCPLDGDTIYSTVGNNTEVGMVKDCIYGPFKDDLSLIRKADDDTATARFLVRGGPKDSRYVLPQVGNGAVPTGFYYEKGASEADAGVIVLQENINEVLWNVGDIDCGIYGAAGITRTFRAK